MFSQIKVLCLLLLISTHSLAVDFLYQSTRFPTKSDINKINSRVNNVILDINAYYPNLDEINDLKSLKLKKLTIYAGHFPTSNQIKQLESLNTTVELILSEVFPSIEEVKNINNSKISHIIVKSEDFPTTGEVNIFNRIKIPLTFEILRRDLPLLEHMIVLRQFKKEITVSFNHHMIPGPGYANFFNSMKASKHFKVKEMPYGQDFLGANALERTTYEIETDKMPMTYEAKTINKFNVAPIIKFTSIFPLNSAIFDTIKQFKTQKTILKDFGHGELFKDSYQVMANKLGSETIFMFNHY